ncbi:MAG: 3',5'-cyclic-nucleotide phosphodiesterase [Acidobacteria bacterium]|nr:3',5'-cyclic-nucleotide phosphodiesterase [Acidobacteriota bacterium]
MKLHLLPSTFNQDGSASPGQHLTCFIIDGRVAIDAGSLGMAATPEHREHVRDVVLTHAHLDHIAGLPLFIDDLFSFLKEPIRIHAAPSVIEVLERDVFNWDVYPRFSELTNENGPVIEYAPFPISSEFSAGHLSIRAVGVNHKVPSVGFIVSDGRSKVAITGDTAEMDIFWNEIAKEEGLSALLVECAFPNEMADLAQVSHHLTPERLAGELEKIGDIDCPVYCVNIKPMFRETVIRQLAELPGRQPQILEVGRVYDL